MKQFGFGLIIFLSTYALAAPQPLSMGLPEILPMAVRNSTELKKALAGMEEAKSTTDKAKGLLFPTIQATAAAGTKKTALGTTTSSSATGVADTYSTALTLTQVLYAGGAVTAGLSNYKAGEELARLNYFSTKQAYLQSVITAFYQVVNTKLKLQTANENVKILKAYQEITGRYEQIGRARKMDRLLAKVNCSLAEQEIEQVNLELAQNEVQLKKLIDYTDSAPLNLQPEWKLQMSEKNDEQKILDTAVKNNPDIRSAQVRLEQVDYQEDVDLATDFPSLSLNGSYGYTSSDRLSLWNDTSNNYLVTLNLTVPIFSGLSSISKRSIYSSKKSQAEKDLYLAQQDLKTKVKNLLAGTVIDQQKMQMTKENLKDAVDALDLANRAYQQGTATSSDVVSFQRTKYDAEKQFIGTQYTYLTDLLELRKWLGIDLEKSYAR